MFLNNRYQILQLLPGGAMGDTFIAYDTWKDSENRCVVKQLKPDKIEPCTIRLFNNEAQTLSKLGSHEQIPELIAHFEQNGNFYLVQEFIQGHNLSREILPNQPWNEEKVIELLQSVLEILVFVHQNNVIHRDIKPGNIMRRDCDRKLVLIDFGGVKQVKSQVYLISENSIAGVQREPTPVVGTYGYMPDEQFKNNAKLCSDIYAVGMLAIQALTGMQPLDLLKMKRDATGNLLVRDRVQVNNSFAQILDKMTKFHYELRYQSAIEALEAIKNLSCTAQYWVESASQLVRQKDYQKAVQACQQAININPKSYLAWYYHGIILRQLKQYDGAIASYDQAINVQPHNPEAWYSRGLILDEIERYDDAIASLERAIQLRQDYPQAWAYRGAILNKLEKYAIALESFDQAIYYQVNNPIALTGRGLTLIYLERYSEAIICFDEAIKIQRNHPETWYHRGVALAKLGKYADANKSYQQALSTKANYYEAWYGRAIMHEKLGYYEDAIIYCDRAIQIQANQPEIWNSRGMILMNLKRYNQALTSFQEALKIQPNHQQANENRKQAEKKLRKPSFLRWL